MRPHLKALAYFSMVVLHPFLIASERSSQEQCFPIERIEVSGAEVLSLKRFNTIVSPFLERCLTLDDINKVLKEVSTYYQSRGYVTSRTYLPQQNLNDGTLTVTVVEGMVEGIDKTGAPGINSFLGFPGIKGNVLNLRDIEQGVDQTNRLGANQLWMELSPGAETGGTVVKLFNNRQKAWTASIRLDNSGQESTGLYQAKLSVTADHLLRLNDYLSVSYQSDLVENSTGRLSESIAFHSDVPVGYWLIALDASANRNRNRVEGELQSFNANGDGNTESLTLSRVAYRNQSRKTEVLASLTRKESNNYIEEVKLDTSSRTLAIAKATLRHQEILPANQVINFQVDYKKGLDLFGSPEKAQGDDAPEPLYGAYAGSMSYQKTFDWLAANHSYSSTMNLQWSDDILFGSEQLSIGGLYSVRGFKGESASGRSGVYLQNSLTSRFGLPIKVLGLHSVSTTLGWDVGGIFDSPTSSSNEELLQGIAFGVGVAGRFYSADLNIGHALSRPAGFSDPRTQLYFSLTARL